jgi:hypothetical protein
VVVKSGKPVYNSAMNDSSDTKVTDLTVGELRDFIYRSVSEAIADPDPDVGLQLREDFVADLLQPEPKGQDITIEELAKIHDFKW